ncbi:MAG: hypothetical protein K6A41_10855 [Bacteroidales bacterium]|nr:hypothetical protein [Bacteroidales bacterium]
MENKNNEHLINKELLDTLNNFNIHSHFDSIDVEKTRMLSDKEENIAKYKEHLNGIREFIDSFDSCIVSDEIMGEWNMIKKDINNYLFNTNIAHDGSCPKIKDFCIRELAHLNSIKNKLGYNNIEYQMICSLVAESVILDVESNMLLVVTICMINRNDYTGRLINNQAYCKMLKDCLNALGNIESLNMEYQYKYERFSPFYKTLSEEGRKKGLIETRKQEEKSGCLGVTMLVILSTLFCSFLLM